MPREQKTLPRFMQKIVDTYGEDKCIQAYELSEAGRSNRDIANDLEISLNAVDYVVTTGDKIEEIREANRRETNAEFVTRVMEYSKAGPIMQVFIIQALDQYAKSVAKKSVDDLRTIFGENNMVSPEAWHRAATELVKELEDRLK